ncbi:MAG: hypothetical protein NTZ26_03760 [Candidatus Aminicenantes bacterium]|nr:hypothetical protein [Candidatus Aminicenantes bacterium]
MRRTGTFLFLAASVVFSLGGLTAFVLIFARHMNVYWFILSPLILAVYQFPGVVMLWLWRRRKKMDSPTPEETSDEKV